MRDEFLYHRLQFLPFAASLELVLVVPVQLQVVSVGVDGGRGSLDLKFKLVSLQFSKPGW